MAKIVLIGLEQTAVGQICRALPVPTHQIANHPPDIPVQELQDADIVFAGGDPAFYLRLLRRVREARPTLPFVVITQTAETNQWLDALEAGATDYCSMPIETRQLHWLVESAAPRVRFASA